MSFSQAAFSLPRRASSFSRSTSSSIGMKMRAASVTTCTAPSGANRSPISTSEAKASRWKKGIPCRKTSASPVAM